MLATDGSIVYIGANGHLIGNTGQTDSSGVVALGVGSSTLQSGDSTRRTDAPAASSLANASFLSIVPQGGADGRSIAVSGFEDHSVSVLGDDQIVTYDDSNVFIARNGQINANTGDTDSSGLNVVDVTGSRVRSGNSGDGEGDDEGSDDEAEEESTAGEGAQATATKEAAPQVAADNAPKKTSSGAVKTSGGAAKKASSGAAKKASSGAAKKVSGDTAQSTSSSDDEDAQGNDEAAEDGSTKSRQPQGATSAQVTDEGASTATGRESLVVGADGYDDVSIRSQGNRNIVTYDDSNVVIGGKGNVNAQIGDSDTGGAVVMGVHNSDVQAGCEGDLCYSATPKAK